MKKGRAIKILMATIILILFLLIISCGYNDIFRRSLESEDEAVEIDEAPESEVEETKEPVDEEVKAEETVKEPVDEEIESDEVIGDEKEEDAEDPAADEEILMDTVLSFFDAVMQDNEYRFFSSGTIDMAGSEEEYRNGDKSDIYFIIQESHSSWENIEFESITIVDDLAIVEFIGDRMVEGTKYEGDKVVFDFVKENDEWKIDFSF